MKRPFALLLLNAPETDSDAAHTLLAQIGKQYALPVYTEHIIGCGAVCRLNGIPKETIMLIAGQPSAGSLEATCRTLYDHDFDLMIVIDALTNRGQLHQKLVHLNEWPVQIIKTGAVPSLLRAKRFMYYAHPKVDCTTTTMIITDAGTPEARVLTIVRSNEPFKGRHSGPGGFLNALLEDMPHCAAREPFEETHINPPVDQLILVDVRSDPDRDFRHHVVDHGYVWFVPDDRKAEVLEAAVAGDDAFPGSARFELVTDVLNDGLAFDHRELLVAALKLAPASK